MSPCETGAAGGYSGRGTAVGTVPCGCGMACMPLDHGLSRNHTGKCVARHVCRGPAARSGCSLSACKSTVAVRAAAAGRFCRSSRATALTALHGISVTLT